MNKTWRIIAHEYTRHVLRKRFLFSILSVPLIIIFMVVLVFILMNLQTNNTPIGYVDQSGLLTNPLPPPPPDPTSKPITMIPYATEAEAGAALKSKAIQAYYVLEPNYLQTGQAKLVFLEEPKDYAKEQFRSFIVANLLAGHPAGVVRRITEGNNIIVRSEDGSRQMSGKDWFNILVPFIAGVAFIIAIFTSSGYLLQAVVEEKENRTMEIIVTSVSPAQLMTGKIIGDIFIGLTQFAGWIAFVVLTVLIGRHYFSWLNAVSLSPGMVWLVVAILLPSFVMVAALMATVGATVTEASEGQQIAGLFSLPVWIPYILIYPIMSNPNGSLAIALSFFPFTAPLTVILRAGFTIIPSWQIALSMVILVCSAMGALWLAGRAFRRGMLQYGRRLTWGEIFGKQRA